MLLFCLSEFLYWDLVAVSGTFYKSISRGYWQITQIFIVFWYGEVFNIRLGMFMLYIYQFILMDLIYRLCIIFLFINVNIQVNQVLNLFLNFQWYIC